MARKRITMDKIRKVIRLKTQSGLSDREIARALNISRPAVARYWLGFQTSGASALHIEQMADSELLALIEKKNVKEMNTRYQKLLSYFPYFVLELNRTGVTLQLLWEEYQHKHPDGYQYSQFCHHFHQWRDGTEVRMHIKHKPGEKMFVDYAGKKLSYIDPGSRKEVFPETFVAVLGGSGLTYVEASESQEKWEWIRSNERAFRYFGGSTDAIVPDNLASAVSRADRYEPEINPDYAEFAEYYGTVIFPARVRKARDKALAENAVGLVYQRIYAPLRNITFYSLQELNEAIWRSLQEYNNRKLQRMRISRRELFGKIEQSKLNPLPRDPFPLKTTVYRTVAFHYHVELRDDLHYYSVPYYLYSKEPKRKVKVVYDERIVSIYHDNIRIAQHKRDRTPNEYSTLPHHMPEHHRKYSGWSPQKFLGWARSIGTDVAHTIDKVLKGRKFPEQAYRVCLGILSLAKKYGNEQLNAACKKAASRGTCSYKRIESILKLAAEEAKHPKLDLDFGIPEHKNIRGSHYYH